MLKPGGACLVLSARRGLKQIAPCLREETPFETVRDIIDAAKDAGFAHLSVSVPSVSVPRTAP